MVIVTMVAVLRPPLVFFGTLLSSVVVCFDTLVVCVFTGASGVGLLVPAFVAGSVG